MVVSTVDLAAFLVFRLEQNNSSTSQTCFEMQEDALGSFTEISRDRLIRTFHVNLIAMFRLGQMVQLLDRPMHGMHIG